MPTSHLSFDAWEGRYADRMDTMRRSAVRDLFAAISRPGVIGLSGGMPDINVLPIDEVAKMAERAIREEGVRALQYGSSSGRVETRQVICELLAEQDIQADPDDIILLGGSQQGLDFLGRTFINPGDTIICEGPSYLGALQAFSAYQPNMVCIDMDDDGMRIDLLEEKLKELGSQGAKFIYTIPTFQNPAGVTMTLERRKRLVELAREYDIPVVEDDPYSRLCFEGEIPTHLKVLDPDNVIYLGTVSKIFAPGLRLAWCVAPRHFLERMNLAKQGADLCSSTFTMVMVERYFREIDWKKVMEDVRALYRERRDAMISALEELFPKEAKWTHPRGGFFLWVTLPEYFDTEQMLSVALAKGVAYVPGTNCYPDGRGRSSFRIAFCYEKPEVIREAIARLADVIEDRMALYRAFMDAGALKNSSLQD